MWCVTRATKLIPKTENVYRSVETWGFHRGLNVSFPRWRKAETVNAKPKTYTVISLFLTFALILYHDPRSSGLFKEKIYKTRQAWNWHLVVALGTWTRFLALLVTEPLLVRTSNELQNTPASKNTIQWKKVKWYWIRCRSGFDLLKMNNLSRVFSGLQ